MGVNRDEGGVLSTNYQTPNLTQGIINLSRSTGLNASTIIASNKFPLGTFPINSTTLDVFNTTVRIYTDNSFTCTNEFVAYAGVKNKVLPHIWFYEFNRTYQDPGYNSNGYCTPIVTPTHPYGDPNLEVCFTQQKVMKERRS